MDIELTIKNYRCFPDAEPARLTITEGWTALLGPNNAGKSALLRMVFELRQCWQLLSNRANLAGWLENRNGISLSGTQQIRDVASLLNDRSDRPLSIQMVGRDGMNVQEATITVQRGSTTPELTTLTGREVYMPTGQRQIVSREPYHIRVGESGDVSIKLLHDACDRLARAFYVGAYRNVLNTGGRADWTSPRIVDSV